MNIPIFILLALFTLGLSWAFDRNPTLTIMFVIFVLALAWNHFIRNKE